MTQSLLIIFAETITCDVNWRSIRDGLVNSMLAFSIICLIISILLVCVNFKWNLENNKRNPQDLEDSTEVSGACYIYLPLYLKPIALVIIIEGPRVFSLAHYNVIISCTCTAILISYIIMSNLSSSSDNDYSTIPDGVWQTDVLSHHNSAPPPQELNFIFIWQK